jgi:hypothetical protein
MSVLTACAGATSGRTVVDVVLVRTVDVLLFVGLIGVHRVGDVGDEVAHDSQRAASGPLAASLDAARGAADPRC